MMAKPVRHYVRPMQGMSLVELLIAMTLGLILMAGMLAVFSSNKRSSELNTAMANIQENARFALNALSKDIRVAGYQGCLDTRTGLPTVVSAQAPIPQTGTTITGNPIFDFSRSSITGSVVLTEANWDPAIPGDFIPPVTNKAIPGTHVLAVQFGDTNQSKLIDTIAIDGNPNRNGPIITADDLDLEAGDLAIIASCDNVDLFTVTAAEPSGAGQKLTHSAPENLSGSLQTEYGLPNDIAVTRVMPFLSHIYYVGDTGLTNSNGDTIRALYQQSYPYNDAENPASEIVQGVENMRLAYGIRTQNTLQYVTANDAAFDPSQVESVQIGLIMTSWERISENDDESTYIIAGQSIEALANSDDGLTHAEDGRYRLVFNTTVKVRNRRENSIVNAQQAAAAEL